MASLKGHKRIVELLLDSGADVDIADEVTTQYYRSRDRCSAT